MYNNATYRKMNLYAGPAFSLRQRCSPKLCNAVECITFYIYMVFIIYLYTSVIFTKRDEQDILHTQVAQKFQYVQTVSHCSMRENFRTNSARTRRVTCFAFSVTEQLTASNASEWRVTSHRQNIRSCSQRL